MWWRFKTLPRDYRERLGTDNSETSRMIEWLAEQLSVKSLDDWYRVSLIQIREWVLIDSRLELGKMLQLSYPEHSWNMKMFEFASHPKSSQREALAAIQQLFPTHGMLDYLYFVHRLTSSDVEEDFKHPQMVHSTGQIMQLDVYIEDLKLAIEYQGEQHYLPAYWTGKDIEAQRIRDEEKRVACKQVGVLCH